MKPEDIAKLPTPETDEVHYGCAIYDDDISRYRDMAEHAQTIERKLAAAVMALEDCAVELREIVARDGVPYTHQGVQASVDEDYFRSVAVNAIETLAALKESK